MLKSPQHKSSMGMLNNYGSNGNLGGFASSMTMGTGVGGGGMF